MSSPVRESAPCDSPPPDSDNVQNNETGDNPTDSSSDSDNNDRQIVAETKNGPTFTLRMLNLCKEVTIMVLIAVVYATLTNESPPKVSKSPAAYPFFPKGSLVTDWYRGQITEAIEDARSSDIAFVMFYAPWDAESQAARSQFELAAEFMHDKVAFASINCWQPGSECKRQYSKVYKWPVLIAYPTHGRGIQYNGPLEAFHMIRFLQNICKPIVRPNKIENLIGKYDTIVEGNVNLLPGSYEYAVFYSTALRFLERDPFRDIIFAVLPQKNTSKANIYLHVWNGTIEYESDWNPESLLAWIVKNLHQIAAWVSPTGMKSLTMSSFIQPGPTLILFTPKNPLQEEADLHNMLRELAYEYHNCENDSTMITKQNLIALERLRNREIYYKLKQKCMQELNNPKEVVTSSANIWTNNSMKNICNCVSTEVTKVCGDNDILISNVDKMSPEYLQKSVMDEECQMFRLSQKYSVAVFEKTVKRENFNITGFACKTNLTLTFVVLDSLKFYHFAEKLGIKLNELNDKSSAVIIDEKMETHHVLEDYLNSKNLRLFIQNFTEKTLSRSLLSRTRLKTKNSPMYSHLNCSSKQENIFCLDELTSVNFVDTIMQPNKVIIVFYYSKQCSFCSGISYVFLTVAKKLSEISTIIFSRIDGDINLLPWEYTMETYPTILFIPANRKSESRTFPRNLQITVPNLMGFILTNLEPVVKLKTMWSICCQTQFSDQKMKCITSVRIETLTLIGKTLKEWRNSQRKHKILYKLQVLRHLHLLLAHSPEKISEIQMCLSRLRD